MKIHCVDCVGIWGSIIINSQSVDQAATQLFDRLKLTCIDLPNCNLLIVGCLVWESYYVAQPEKYDPIIQQCTQLFMDQYGAKLVFVIDNVYKLRWKSMLDNVIYIDFHKLRLHYAKQLKSQEFSNQWNHSSTQWLLLSGKTTKIHRTRLLWKLANKNLLQDCYWSFWVSHEGLHHLVKHFPELSKEEISNFVEQHARLPNDLAVRDDMVVTSGTKWASWLYENKLFKVVLESDFDCHNHTMIISEKTWKAIANSLPFVMVGPPGTCQRLKDQGYYTFEEFCRHPFYDTEQDSECRLNLIVENIQHWTQHLSQYADQIHPQIVHNKKLFWNHVNRDLVKISEIDPNHEWFEIVDFRES